MKHSLLIMFIFLMNAMGIVSMSAQSWAVTDTLIEEGYYRLHVREWTGSTSKIQKGIDSCMTIATYTTTSNSAGDPLYNSGKKALFVRGVSTMNPDDWSYIWHFKKAGMKDGHQTWILKNCGPQAETYFQPDYRPYGQANFIWATGVIQDSVFLRTKDYGSTAARNYSTRSGTAVFNREDETSCPGAIFMRPTSNFWRFRVGGSQLIKLNSYNRTGLQEFILEKVDLSEQMARMQLNEYITDLRGLGLKVGANPGNVSSETAFTAFDNVLTEATALFEGVAVANEKYTEMQEKLKTAYENVKPYIVPLDGYVRIRAKALYKTGEIFKAMWMVPYDDSQRRVKDTQYFALPDAAGDILQWGRNDARTGWYPTKWKLGYEFNSNEGDFLPQEYIWHVQPTGNGNYTLKSCAESDVIGDLTYMDMALVWTKYNKGDIPDESKDPFCEFGMRGTPASQTIIRHVTANEFNMSDTLWPDVLIGLTHYNHMAGTWGHSAGALGQYVFETVDPSFITPKFKLNEAITEAGGIVVDWNPSENPGCLKLSLAQPMLDALAAARKVYNKNSATDAEYSAAEQALVDATDALKLKLIDTANVVNPIEEGYYRFVNANARFQQKQNDNAIGVIYATGTNQLLGDVNLKDDMKNPYKIFKIEKLGDGTFSAMNVATGKYITGKGENGNAVILGKEQKGLQFINDDGGDRSETKYNWFPTRGHYHIAVASNAFLTPNGHSSGTGTSGYVEAIGPASQANRLFDRWVLQKETDANMIKSIENGEFSQATSQMKVAIENANNMGEYLHAYTIKMDEPLITDVTDGRGSCNIRNTWTDGQIYTAGQMSTNAPALTLQPLIEMEDYYWWMSRWSGAGPSAEDHYLQYDLRDKPQQTFSFLYKTRCRNIPVVGADADYGHKYRPAAFDIYATNTPEDASSWVKVKELNNMPFQTDVRYRTYRSPVIEMDQPYRYIRISVPANLNGGKITGHAYWSAGFLQLYPAVYDEANSPITWNTEIQAAVEKLNAAIEEGKKQLAAGAAQVETVDDIESAINDIKNCTADTMALAAKLIDARALYDSAYVEDDLELQQFGDVTTEQKAEFRAAMQQAYDAMAPAAHPTQESINAALAKLEKDCEDFQAMRKKFDEGKWYYITSTAMVYDNANFSSYGSDNYKVYHTARPEYRYGHAMFVTDANAQDAYNQESAAGKVGPIRYGYYWDFKAARDYAGVEGFEYKVSGAQNWTNVATLDLRDGNIELVENNPAAMWRFKKMPGEKELYAVQNRATGMYLGRNQDNDWYITQSKEPIGFEINLLGRNQYEIVNVDTINGLSVTTKKVLDEPLHSQKNDLRMVWYGSENVTSNSGRGYGTASSYTFKPVDETSVTDFLFPVKNNNIQIITLPCAINTDYLVADNTDLACYGLKNVTIKNGTDFSLELVEKNSFNAGEPFVLITGDPEKADSRDSTSLWMPSYAEPVTESKTVNGLVGLLNGQTVVAGYGIFENAAAVATTDATFVNGRTGYIDPTQVSDLEVPAGAKVITLEGQGIINAIHSAVSSNKNNKVDVFSVDGKLLRHDVKASQATQGLKKGIYIIGKEKVMVK